MATVGDLGDCHTFIFNPAVKRMNLSTVGSVHYDVCNNEVVAVCPGYVVHFSPIVNSSGRSFNHANVEGVSYKIASDLPLRIARRSLDRANIALVLGPTDVHLFDTIGSECTVCEIISCKQLSLRPNKNNFQVRDVLWLSPETLLIVCSSYMDIYRVLPPGPQGAPRRTRTTYLKRVTTTVDYHHYSPQHNLMLVVNREKRDIIKPYLVTQPEYTLRSLDKIIVSPEHSMDHTNPIPNHGDYLPRTPTDLLIYLRVITLYGVCFVVHVTPRQEILLYFLNIETTQFDRVMSVNIYDDGSVGINVVDNLLIVHNLTKRLTFMYDIRTKLRVGSTLHPLCLPLEMKAVKAGPTGLCAVHDCNVAALYNGVGCEFHNTVHGPIVFDKFCGRIYSIGINLQEVSRSLQSTTCLEFLMRRSSSVPYILAILQTMVMDPVYQLSNLAAAFAMINVPYSDATRRKVVTRSSHSPTAAAQRQHSRQMFASEAHAGVFPPPPPGTTGDAETLPMPMSIQTDNDVHVSNRYQQIVEQLEVYKSVFHPFVDEQKVRRTHLIAVVVEYVYSLAQQQIALHELIQRFLIDLFIHNRGDAPPFHILHQLLMFRVIEDSEPVAMQLLKLEDVYPPAFQVALDMLVRVKAFPIIVHVLLTRNMVIRALEILLYNKLTGIPLHNFFERIPDDGTSNAQFIAVFELAVKYIRTVRGVEDGAFHDTDRCEWVIQRYHTLATHPLFLGSPIASPRAKSSPMFKQSGGGSIGV